MEAIRENFEAAFTEFEILSPNQLVEGVQRLWAQTVGSVTEEGFSEHWPRSYADDQRQAFLEQIRAYFGLPQLYESSPEVIRRAEERYISRGDPDFTKKRQKGHRSSS